MTITEKDCLNAKNSTVRTTSAHETCSQYVMFIHERYPRLKSLKYRKRGKRYIFRAKWACRVLYAFGPSPEYAMSRFLLEILRKVFTERLMTREEYRAVRQELHRREIMSYAVYETVEK